MTLRTRSFTEVYCTVCGFVQNLRENQTPPLSCPACGDGKSKSWEFSKTTDGEDND